MAEKKRYPQMVYGPGAEQKIINGPEEMPNGFMTYDEKYGTGRSKSVDDAAAGAILAAEAASSKAAAADAQAARDAAAKAEQELKDAHEEKAHRDKLKAFLTEHNVDFAPQSGTPKLEDLAGQLREHLAEKEANDSGE